MPINERAESLLENFSFLDSWEEKYQYIIDLGKTLPALSPEDMCEDNRVRGCMSQVWLVIENREGILYARADSDAIIVRGLIAIVHTLIHETSAQEVAQFDFLKFFQQIGLDRQLSPNRRNGLVSLLERVRKSAH